MPDISWPTSLPTMPLMQGTQYQPRSNSTAIPPEAGEFLTRRRFTGETATMPIAMVLTIAQAQRLMEFYRQDVEETQPFLFIDPILGHQVLCVFNTPPSFTFIGQDRVSTSFSLVTKPTVS